MVSCPFCGAPETDRFDLEGHRYLVFQCMFTPEVDREGSDAAIGQHLAREYGSGRGRGHFRRMCDRLHVYVTQGDGAKALTADRDP